MSDIAPCPKCRSAKIFVCQNRQPDWESSNDIRPLIVATVPFPCRDLGTKSGSAHRTHAGAFETRICAGCGFTEWYAQDPEGLLEKLSRMPGSGVRLVTVPAGA